MRFRLNCSNHPRLNGGITVSVDTTELDLEVGLFEPWRWSPERVLEVVEDIPTDEIGAFLRAIDYMNPNEDPRHRDEDRWRGSMADLLEGTNIPVEEEEPPDDE